MIWYFKKHIIKTNKRNNIIYFNAFYLTKKGAFEINCNNLNK